jgi:hypothetical protein
LRAEAKQKAISRISGIAGIMVVIAFNYFHTHHKTNIEPRSVPINAQQENNTQIEPRSHTPLTQEQIQQLRAKFGIPPQGFNTSSRERPQLQEQDWQKTLQNVQSFHAGDASGATDRGSQTTFCNGTYYSPCPEDMEFVCPTTGEAYCLPQSDEIFACNGKNWSACPPGSTFNCPPQGDAECVPL